MGRIFVTGETLIDFVPVSSGLGPAFAPRCGGSTYNVARAAALQGADVEYFGPVSSDMFGDRLVAGLAETGVGLSCVSRVDHPTTLAFVEFSGRDARYAFFNAMTATQLADHSQTALPVAKGDILHCGSISLIDNPGGASITDFVVQVPDVTLSLDPNARPGMIRDLPAWRSRINRLIDRAGIVKLSDEDLAVLEPDTTPEACLNALLERGVALAVITLGAKGAVAATPAGRVSVPGYSEQVTDTVGAGDTVTGTLLAALAGKSTDQIAMLDSAMLDSLVARAMAAAWLNCQFAGCNPPDRAAIDGLLGLGSDGKLPLG